MDQIKIFKSDVLNFLENIPPNSIIPLKNNYTIQLTPDQILDHIENKTKIGKKYYLQIGVFLYKNKKNDIENFFENNDIMYLY